MTFDRYVGLPWLEGGCGFDGVDCWGLLSLFYREERGIELNPYSMDQRPEVDAEAMDTGWEKAETPRPGDGAVYKRAGTGIYHVGLVAPRGMLLHIEKDRTSVLIRGNPIGARLIGHYRRSA